MKNFAFFILFFCAQLLFAQNVYLSKVVKINDNSDKFLYTISGDIDEAEFLGEVEVQGFSTDDAEVFSKIYKKAKEIGANAFSLKLQEGVDGKIIEFNPANYKLNLYYLPKDKTAKQQGDVYIFASSSKKQKISINNKDYTISPRSFLKLKMITDEIYTISTKKLLGSTIKIKKNNNDADQYYQISGLKMGGNHQNDGMLHLKSGDIIGLERSYAEFLSIIYKDIN